ncbi:MAG: hypothetical protein ACM3JH_04875 [Acidithiobacillales bacterium]
MRSFSRFLLAFLVPLAVAVAVFLLPSASRKKGDRGRAAEPSVSHRLDLTGRTAAENRAIAAALEALEKEKGSPALRVAEDDDAAPSDDRDDLKDLYGTYHPYFVRGDLNGDGLPDFAQAFVEKGPSGWFHVAVFFARPDGSFLQPVWVERAVSLAAGDISMERSLLIVVPDLSLDDVRRWRWDLIEHRFVDADAEGASGGDSGDVAPEGKRRVRI